MPITHGITKTSRHGFICVLTIVLITVLLQESLKLRPQCRLKKHFKEIQYILCGFILLLILGLRRGQDLGYWSQQ